MVSKGHFGNFKRQLITFSLIFDLGRLNHGNIAKFGQILELHKSYLDITLKKGSKWPGDYKWQTPTTKFGM